MGKPVVVKNCLRCNKEFSTKPKKNKVTKEWEEEDYCQGCRHLREIYKQRKVKDRTTVRVVADKADLRNEVEGLRRLERFNPALLSRLRKNEK